MVKKVKSETNGTENDELAVLEILQRQNLADTCHWVNHNYRSILVIESNAIIAFSYRFPCKSMMVLSQLTPHFRTCSVQTHVQLTKPLPFMKPARSTEHLKLLKWHTMQ